MNYIRNIIASLLLLSLFFSENCYAQEYAPPIGDINVVDAKGFRQGFWKVTAAITKSPGYTPEQIVAEGNYTDSRETGVWITYSNSGSKLATVTYKMGLKDGLCEYYSREGNKISSTEYTKGIWNGLRKVYYPDGKLLMESHWNFGEMVGTVKTYYPTGKLYEEGTWANGWFIGDYNIYNENGTLKREVLPPITQ